MNYEGLRKFYNHTIHPELMRMDTKRKKLLTQFFIGSVLILSVLILTISIKIFVLTLALAIPISLYLIYLYNQLQKFKKTFKPRIIRLILDFIDNEPNYGTLYYEEGRSIDRQEFEFSQLFSDEIIEYNGEDYINGKIGELSFELCELQAKAFSKVRTKIDTVFRGVFLHAEFKDFKKRLTLNTRLNDISQRIRTINAVELLNANVDAYTLELQKDELSKLLTEKQGIEYELNNLYFNEEESELAAKIKGRIMIIPRENKNFEIRTIKKFLLSGAKDVTTEMQDPEFQEMFLTYATADASIHTLLSLEMQKDILDYYDFTESNLYISVIGNDIYVAINEPNDLLEPYIFQSNVSYDLIREFYEKLIILMKIVKDFDENN